MEQCPLGKSGLSVSIIALGTGAMGEKSNGQRIDDREAIAAVHQAIDAGCNLIDTAPSYGWGHAEELVGKAIVGRRDDVLIATKCGLIAPRNGDAIPRRTLTQTSILQECEQSLRRLRIEVIDLYQCQQPDPLTPIRETMEALQTLRTQGKIRAAGLCNFGCEEIAAAREFGGIDAVQTAFSILHRRPADDLLPFCSEHGMAVLAHSPLAKGLLTGTLSAESRFSGMRAREPDFVGERFRRNLRIVERLREVADASGKTLTQLAVNWAAYHPGVTAPIVGVQRPSHVVDVLGGIGWNLSAEDRARIDRILRDDGVES